MTAAFLRAYAATLASDQWPAPEETSYVPPPANGPFVTDYLPTAIAADQPEVRAEYTYCPAEARTRDYPGMPEGAVIERIVGLDRELTDAEEAAVFADDGLIHALVCLAVEDKHEGYAIARDRAEEWRYEDWRLEGTRPAIPGHDFRTDRAVDVFDRDGDWWSTR